MLVPSFGLDRFDGNRNLRREAIDKFILEFSDNVDSITAKMLIREIYQKTYGLIPLGQSHHPKHLTSILPKENTSVGSLMSQWFRRYLKHDVARYTLMNFPEFMSLPRARCEMIIRDILVHQQSENRQLDSARSKLENFVQQNPKFPK